MYLSDFHTHSRISPDASCSMAEMALAAADKGLQEICFTDHLEPVNWYTQVPRDPFDWQALLAEYREALEAAGDRIRIRLGVELGDAPRDTAHIERLMSDAPELDFIIGSEHMLPADYGWIDLSQFEPAGEAEARAGIAAYLALVAQMARWGRFCVLGHLTLPLRYLNEKRGFRLTFDGFEAEVEDIFRTLIQNGCGIEVNTNRGREPLPGAKWLKLYRQLGGEVVTLGSDAHRPQHVGLGIREGRQLLQACGFSYVCTFEKMQPIFHKL